MIIGLLVVTIIGLIWGRQKYKTWVNPYCVFNLLWATISLLLLIGNNYIDEPSMIAKKIVFIGVLGFNFSIIIPKIIINKYIKYDRKYNYYIKNRSVLNISIIVVLLSFFSAFSSIQSLISGSGLALIRSDYYTYSDQKDIYMYYLRNYILNPLSYVVLVITILNYFQGKKSRTLLLNSILIILLQAITNGGRYILMNTIFMIVCAGFVLQIGKNLTRKYKILFLVLISLLMWGIVFLTNDRATYLTTNMSTLERLYETIYQYFAGSVTYLGKVIEEYSFIKGSTLGINLIAGLISPFFVVLNFLNFIPYPEFLSTIGLYANQVLKIGPSLYYNAMPTIFGYFYIDGGLILTFVEATIFGYVCKQFYELANRKSLLYIGFYMLIFTQICNSSTRWFFYTSDFVLAFIYLRLFMKKTGYDSSYG